MFGSRQHPHVDGRLTTGLHARPLLDPIPAGGPGKPACGISARTVVPAARRNRRRPFVSRRGDAPPRRNLQGHVVYAAIAIGELRKPMSEQHESANRRVPRYARDPFHVEGQLAVWGHRVA